MTEEKKETEKEEEKEEKYDYLPDFDDKEAYCNWVDKQVKEHPVVKVHHGKWKELIEWENGNQFSLWNESKGRVHPVELKVRKAKIVVNLMKPLNETLEGKINFFHQSIGVPNSGEQKDIKGASVATKLIDYNDYVNDMEDFMEDVKHDLLRPGLACEKWIWDLDASGYVKLENKDNIENVEEQGEVIGEVVPIFNIRPDPVAKNPKELRWVIEVKEVTREKLKKAFDLKDTELDNLEQKTGGSDKYKGMHEVEEEKDKEEPTMILVEHWQRPNNLLPKGRMVFSCGGKVLWGNANPSPKHKLPYFFHFYKKTNYSFWSKGPLHFVQGIQRAYNRMVSLIAEHIEAWRPKMSVGKGALKRAGSMTIDNFEIVEVDYSRGEPRPIATPELSSQVVYFRDYLESAVDKVSNVHEVSYARLPQYASRAPASLYSMMLEQENIKLNPMMKRTNKTILHRNQFRLELMDMHYSQERMIKIVGEGRKSAVEYFSKSDLNENFDMRMDIGVSLNQSNTIQQRLLLELWREGIFDKEQDRMKIIELLNMGTASHALRTDIVDRDRALRENQAFLDDNYKKKKDEGGVFVWIHDDHALHINTHTDFGKEEDAQKWPPQRWSDFEEHIMTHVNFLAMLQGGRGATEAATAGVEGAEGLPGEVGPGAPPGPAPEEGPGMGEEIEGTAPPETLP